MEPDRIFEAVKKIEDGMTMLSRGPASFYLRQLVAARDLLLTRFSPFKVGDRVTLLNPYDPEMVTGWSHCKHFLIPGSSATIRHAECSTEGVLVFDLEFDNETWVDDHGIERPVSSKHIFRFAENMIAKIEDNAPLSRK